MVDGQLFEYGVLLALSSDGGLISAEDFIGLSDWYLFNGDVCALSIFDDNGWSVLAMAEEWSTCAREIEAH